VSENTVISRSLLITEIQIDSMKSFQRMYVLKRNKMLIYLEKQAKKYELTSRILGKFQGNQIIEIDNYKNIFDKNINFPTEKILIIAKLN